ncbi:MAG: 50S ribosomal protein L5 [Candidatus Diapherotrites archaeon]|nr:50S ribosomal protein L5 [Candidatus Diapherotrites archaeon]
MSEKNPITALKLEKVVLNIGAGEPGNKLNHAVTLLERITGKKATKTKCKVKEPKWSLREGLEIGTKITLRRNDADEMLKRALVVVDNTLKKSSVSENGNISFGVPEYIDLPGIEYDPDLGIMGFDVCIKLKKAGERVSRRKIRPKKMPKRHKSTKEETINFLQEKYGVKFE